MGLVIGVDIGGTKVAAAVVDEDGVMIDKLRVDTPAGTPGSVNDAIADLVWQLRERHEVDAVGMGAPGFVSADRSTVLFTPNLSWRAEPLGAEMTERLKLPVVVENDANCAAWAEVRFGAAKGEQNVVVLTIGTGIGGGIIIGGQLVRGEFGVAAEIGHMNVVIEGGLRCGCGNRGCWEQYGSGRALVRDAQDFARISPSLAQRMLELAGGDPEKITGPEVTRAAQEGDPAALEIYRVIAGSIGYGMADLAAALDPAVFVIGGGVADAGELLREPVEKAYLERLTGRGRRPLAKVLIAQLGGEAGIVGAADLARLPH
ncbi:MAG: glucokinase [Pseudonocardiales bacterium]|jgi:glucokinase|nr:glucokinase [Pseudonocardia sp.]MDT7590009.1 glucokinase [Pseudonocardiales bacterium]MDT7592845.1 glucokinase [Pseudonocardiales bacterium]MDT7598721.1 glucokinase [Pseudonocardiales bacterium]MDT7611956.1 glucokinase [Pseudonocardiales bacterium]